MNRRLSHFFTMIYGLLLKHIELANPTEPIRAELRPPDPDGHNPNLNGEAAPDNRAGQQRRSPDRL
jgi:hypothetical protein